MRRTSLLVLSTFALALCARSAAQQPPPDTLKLDYFDNAQTNGVPDGTLRLTNPDSSGSNTCAAIFVFDEFQEMSECCSCLLSPNGLRTLSVNTDLTSNPLTGVILHTGTVSIVSAATVSGTCPILNILTTLTPTSGGVRAWSTHIDHLRLANKTGGFVGTVTPSQDATLSSSEQTLLAEVCYAVILDGSSRGICSCGTGD